MKEEYRKRLRGVRDIGFKECVIKETDEGRRRRADEKQPHSAASLLLCNPVGSLKENREECDENIPEFLIHECCSLFPLKYRQ